MPVTLNQIASSHASVTRHFKEGSLTIEYDPNLITEETFAQLNAFSKMSAAMSEADIFESFRTFNKLLVSLIRSWDLLENDGVTVVPITVERMAGVAIPIRLLAIEMITGDIRPEVMALQA